MRVAFMPLDPRCGKDSIIITQFPVILTRSSRSRLTPEASTVSPHHCEIDAVQGVLVVRDLGSRHGTFVNETRVTEACLWPGSKLTVGINSFFVCYSLQEHAHVFGAGPAPGQPDSSNESQPGLDTAGPDGVNLWAVG